jgi:hypothetical protein
VVNGARMVSASTTSATCRRGPRCGPSPAPSRLGVRTGAPAAQGGTELGPLRGLLLDGAAPARADDLPPSPDCSTSALPSSARRGRGNCPAKFRVRHHRRACR